MAKKAAFGTRLLITDPADSTQFRVHHVGDINGPSIEVTAIDATNHDSPDAFAEYLPGVGDAGEVTFDLFFDPSDTWHARLIELVSLRRITSFALLLPKASASSFILNPQFEDGGDGWMLGAGGGFSTASGAAVYLSSNPATFDTVTCDVALLPLETYTVAVTFAAGATDTGAINITYDGAVIGTVNPAMGGTQTVTFDCPYGSELGEIGVEVPSTINAPTSFRIIDFTVSGIAEHDLERFEFGGFITKVGALLPVKDAMKAPVTIKASGAPNYVSGAS